MSYEKGCLEDEVDVVGYASLLEADLPFGYLDWFVPFAD